MSLHTCQHLTSESVAHCSSMSPACLHASALPQLLLRILNVKQLQKSLQLLGHACARAAVPARHTEALCCCPCCNTAAAAAAHLLDCGRVLHLGLPAALNQRAHSKWQRQACSTARGSSQERIRVRGLLRAALHLVRSCMAASTGKRSCIRCHCSMLRPGMAAAACWAVGEFCACGG